MPGRHSDPAAQRGPGLIFLLIAGVIIAGLGGATYLGWQQFGPGSDNCEDVTTVSVAVTPELGSVAASSADRAANESCYTYDVTTRSSAQIAGLAATGSDELPDVWIADSTVWQSLLADEPRTPETVLETTAATPITLVERAGDDLTPATWTEVLANPEFVSQSPELSATAMIAVISGQVERQEGLVDEDTANSAIVALAQRYGGTPPPESEQEVLEYVVENGGLGLVAGVTLEAESAPDGLSAVVPESGAMSLDYPMYSFVDDAATEENINLSDAISALETDLGSSQTYEELLAAGFNVPSSAATPDAPSPLAAAQAVLADPELVESVTTAWARMNLPGRALVVIDVSGSMAFAAAESTRIGLTAGSLQVGLSVLPDSWAIGSWAFSENLDGEQDWLELAPIQSLGDTEHRAQLQQLTDNLPGLVNGGTGLYSTVIAATRAVRESYDPEAFNSIMLFTDGQNDVTGGPTLEETLAILVDEFDPERPVAIITIGISEDADAEVLEQIANTNPHGRTYIARDPEEIRTVFLDSVGQR